MKTTNVILIVLITVIIAACSSSKKGLTSTVAPEPPPIAATSNSPDYMLTNATTGIHAPGNEELTAIQLQYKTITLEKLKEGHSIYTQGACINCHKAKNIYEYGDVQWKSIIEDMAEKARISDVDKDAVYKYVLAMKATQPK